MTTSDSQSSIKATQALFDAVWACDVDGVRSSVESGANLRSHDEQGFSPLAAAVVGGVPMVRLMLNAGADPNFTNKNGTTPIIGATLVADYEMAKLLLDAGAQLHYSTEKGRSTVLHDTIRCGDHQTAMLVLQYATRDDLNMTDASGVTPLMLSRETGNDHMTQVLLNAGAIR